MRQDERVVDRVAERAEETVALVEGSGGTAVAVAGDVTSGDDCAAMVAAATDAFGDLDVVVDNVGIGGRDGGPVSLDEAVWDRIHTVNLKGAYLLCKHALPVLRERGGGAIVLVSSVAAVDVGVAAELEPRAPCPPPPPRPPQS